MSDPCTFPGCGRDEENFRHACYCLRRVITPHLPESSCHSLTPYCHPFQSAREKAGEPIYTAKVGNPSRDGEGNRPLPASNRADPCTFPGCGEEEGHDNHVCFCCDVPYWPEDTCHPPSSQCHPYKSARESKAEASRTMDTAGNGSPVRATDGSEPESFVRAISADNLRADPPAPLRNREATCRACKDFHETGDCPDEFEQMLDLHHALLRSERERAEKAEAELAHHKDPIVDKLLADRDRLAAALRKYLDNGPLEDYNVSAEIEAEARAALKEAEP